MLGRYTYTLSTLTPGEEITLVGRLHYFALIIPFCLTALTFTVLFFAIALTLQLKGGQMLALIQIATIWLGFLALFLFTMVSWLKRNMIEMVCTNKRVVRRTGIVNVTTEELNRERIESVEIRQSILGRIFGYGDILFSGTGTSKLVFHFINQPRLMKRFIDSVINAPAELPPSH
ncbi:MAG: PH domain-containing protein [Alphaproteobacteria bacterium]|nr:PH domain-containing protein [Alphaproteobacteria bacterium]